MRTLAIIAAACLALVLPAGLTEAHAINANAHCTGMTVTDYISSDVNQSTTSANYVDLADGRLNFTTATTGCVTITFSGLGFLSETSQTNFRYLHVRTLLDGQSLCGPALYNDVFLGDSPPGPFSANSFTRICKNVTPGAHSVRVQFRSDLSGYTVGIDGHVLTLTHN